MVKLAVEFRWKLLLTLFPSKSSSKISFQTSPEVRHQFRRKLRQLHSGNRWCLKILGKESKNAPKSKEYRKNENQEDVNGEKLTVKKWWIFGADFSRFTQSFSQFIRDINGDKKKHLVIDDLFHG